MPTSFARFSLPTSALPIRDRWRFTPGADRPPLPFPTDPQRMQVSPEPAESAAVSERAVAAAYERAMRYADAQARGRDDWADRLIDAATDAVLTAAKRWRPELGPFRMFCGLVVATRVRRAKHRFLSRPAMASLSDLENLDGEPFEPAAPPTPIAGGVPMSIELRDLPPELRDAVRFVYVDGHCMRDAGLLMGIGKDAVRKRLHDAAELLAGDDAVKPARARGMKRIRGNGKGH